MKTIKSLFCLLAALLFAASCSEKTEMNTYAGRADEAFFGRTAYTYTVSADMEDACTVQVLRAASAGAASVPVTVVVEDAEAAEAFTAPATVDFADGEIGAAFTVSFDRSKLTIGKEYVIDVELQSETSLSYSTACEVVVVIDYTWKDYKTGVYSSGILPNFFGQAIAWKQVMQVTEENPQLYRLTGLYHNAGTSYSESGYNLNFTWDGSSSTIGFPYSADKNGCVTVASGFSHPSYGMVYLYIDSSPEYSGYDAATKTFTFNCAGLVPYNGSLAQLVDWTDDTFTLND